MKRREFLGLSGAAALVLLVGCSSKGSGKGTAIKGALPIPELMKGVIKDGVVQYDLSIVQAQHPFFVEAKTATYAISGTQASTYLGPTLLLKRGTAVSINYANQLGVATTMHGHGMHVPGAMDGTAHQPIDTGATWSARYTVDQKACTNWYHPHYLHQTAPHVYQGLAGMIIIQDDASAGLGLPDRYGIDDIPMVLQDRNFSGDLTRLDYSPSMRERMHGYIGDVFVTNGAIEPTFDAEAGLLRLRLLNGSNSTVYELGLGGGRSFRQIASDNALLEAPLLMTRLTLSPGERAEILVDLSSARGESVTLKEYRHDRNFLTINVTRETAVSTTMPSHLLALDPVAAPTRTRQFRLGMAGMMGDFTINGKSMEMDRIDVALSRGDVEEWEIINDMMIDHNFHIHGTHFRVVSRNNSTAQVHNNEKGYKDVVYLPANETVKFVVAIPDDGVTADAANPYMFHCHFLEHEDNGMMGQFTVS